MRNLYYSILFERYSGFSQPEIHESIWIIRDFKKGAKKRRTGSLETLGYADISSLVVLENEFTVSVHILIGFLERLSDFHAISH